MANTSTANITEAMQECIALCLQCHSVCLVTLRHCLEVGGRQVERHHITALQDCAEICQTSANFMLRASDLHASCCGGCAEICLACAEECESLDQNDTQLQHCALLCRRCAASCQEMASAM